MASPQCTSYLAACKAASALWLAGINIISWPCEKYQMAGWPGYVCHAASAGQLAMACQLAGLWPASMQKCLADYSSAVYNGSGLSQPK